MGNAVDSIRWLIAVPLGLFGLFGIVCNFACVVKQRSLVPLVGGACVALAWLLCPAMGGRVWAWVPFVLDPGCWIILAACIYIFVVVPLRRRRVEPDATDDWPRE
jgi:hypothetical protein